MGKPTICIGENKDADFTAKLISAFVFATRIVQFLFFLNPKFQVSSFFLCLYRSVCVRPVRKPHCWFSHEVAHIPVYDPYIVSGLHTPSVGFSIFPLEFYESSRNFLYTQSTVYCVSEECPY